MKSFAAIASHRVAAVWLGTLAVVVLSATIAAATMGPKLEMQGQYQQSSNSTSFDGVQESACPNSTICYVLFSKIFAGKQLIVTHASCFVNMVWIADVGTVANVTLQLRRPNGNILLRNQTLTATKSADSFYTVNSPTLQLFDAGDTPVIKIHTDFAANFAEISCSIAGSVFTTP